MTQTDFNVANASGAAVRSDLNAHLDALVSLSSGATAPATTFPNQWWLDTSTNILKQRDNGNTAWVNAVAKAGTGWIPYRNAVLLGTASTKGSASEAAEGTTEIATQAETNTGTDDLRFVTPLKLTNFSGGAFPSGTRMLFQQTTQPTGWTKETIHQKKAIRLQTGAVATGGANPFDVVFGGGKETADHTLLEAEMPSHVHRIGTVNHAPGTGNKASAETAGTVDSLSKGGSGPHKHNLTNFDLQFVDFIIAVKN